MDMDFSWLPPGQDTARLPLGMRVNNPGNIKYNPKLGYAGMLGPSSHTDQGDAQMTFDTPQSGMTAAARLATTKYKRGQTTPMSLIAGQGGWTPGNAQAAANVARTMGIGPNDDLALGDPARMTAFLKALTMQEHGGASKLYGDDIYTAAASGGGGEGMQAGSGYLRQALSAAGAIPGPAQPTVAGGPVQLTAPNMRYSKLADALLASAAGAKPKGWGDLLNSAGDAMLGYTLAGKADKEQGAYKSSLSQALMGANDTDAMARTLMSSGDEDLVKQGVALKVAASKPQPNSERFMTIPGVGVMDMNTRQVVPGTEPKKQEGLMSVAPGNTILDPNSRQPVYTAPAKPEEKKYQFTKYGIGDPETGEIKPYAEGEGKSSELTQEQAKLEQQLRKEYSALSADNRAVQDSVGRMRDSAKLASGPGDIAMIFSYMKMLDPTSVVREGEYATAANASGVPERVLSLYNKAINGQFLTPTMRNEFVTAGETMAKGKLEGFGKLRGQFENIAKSAGADPTRILLDEGSPTPPPAGGAGNAPAGAVEMLRKDPSPDAVREFDEMFGPGASQRALGR